MRLKLLFIMLFMSSLSLLQSQTVVDIIVNSPDHNTLEAAVIAAGLADDLSGPGPFTVFAPTDAAFDALPPGTVAALLDDIPTLTAILTYHVVGAKALSTDLSDGQVITTLNGKDVTVTINGNGVFINNAKVTVADIEADNGVVHVIDAVLLPPSNTVVDIIVNSPDHNTLEAAVIAAGLADALSGDGPFTVFAPTDAAFDALPPGTVAALLNDIPTLTAILTYHVVGAKALSTDLSDGQVITTLNGKDVKVTINGDGVFINNAKVTVADIEADNGVVHVIDAVLLPTLSAKELNVHPFEVYPNPVLNSMKIQMSNRATNIDQIEITNMNGNIVWTGSSESLEKEINLSTLSSGSYIVKIKNKEGVGIKKFIKI